MSTIQRKRADRQLRLAVINAASATPTVEIEWFQARLEFRRAVRRLAVGPMTGPVRDAQRPLSRALEALDAELRP
jgi:hypothetical protein